MLDEPSIPLASTLGMVRYGTNLHYNHSKSKHVRFPRNCIRSPNNLWRGPGNSVFIGLPCGVRSTNDRSELEIHQTSVTVVIDENIGLAEGYQ